MGAEYVGMSVSLRPSQGKARNADRMKSVVRDNLRVGLTWAGLPFQIWKELEGKSPTPPPLASVSART